MDDHPTPNSILDLGFAFFGSKALLSAVELGLFTELARGPLDAGTLQQRLGLHPRSSRDFSTHSWRYVCWNVRAESTAILPKPIAISTA